jgi:hypothetical protein
VHLYAAPIRCPYLINSVKKALSNFMPDYLVPKIEYSEIHHRQGRSNSPNIYSLAKHSRAADMDWYLGYQLA